MVIRSHQVVERCQVIRRAADELLPVRRTSCPSRAVIDGQDIRRTAHRW